MLKTVSTQLALASDTLPEVLAKGNTTGGTDLAVSSGDDITFADNSKAIFGAGSDISIYSDGSTGQVTGSVNVTGAVTTGGLTVNTPSSAEIIGVAGDSLTITARSGDATAANNAGGGFRNIGSATATSRSAQMWLDADGANLGGGDYFYMEKKGNSGDLILSQYSNASMIFRTNADGERLRILPTGGITFNGDTAQANALDDYEEGTWTVTAIGGVTFTGSPTYTGIYTKIGRMVYVSLKIQATDIASVSGYISGGFPFVSANYFTTAPIVNTSSGADLGLGLIGLSGGNTIIYLPTFSGVTSVAFSGFYYV